MFFKLSHSYDLYDHLKDSKAKDLIGFIQERVEIPEYVKTAEDCFDPSGDLDDTFALIVKEGSQSFRRFPLGNKTDAWFSQQSFIKSAEHLPVICRGITASNIKLACDYYDIEVEPWVSKMADTRVSLNGFPPNLVDFDNEEIQLYESEAMAKTAYEDKYALPSIGQYKLNTKTEVKTACDWLEKNLRDLKEDGMEDEFCLNLKLACQKHSVPVPEVVEDILDNTIKISSEFLRPHFDERISTLDELETDRVETVKIAYMNIMENCQFMKKWELEEAIKEADEEVLGVVSYRHFMSPKDIVESASDMTKQAQGSTSYIESDYTYETGDPQYLSAARASEANAKKEKAEKIQNKVRETPEMLKGYFDNETISALAKDFKKTYQDMSSEDKQTVQKVYRETVGDSDE